MAGITRRDRACNQDIRQRLDVAPITDGGARLRRYDNVLRADNDNICEIGFSFDAPGQKHARSNYGWTPCTPI
ncbi:hypothetical protein ANCDUO_08891 [Ancylostoma duodenale]|uniref:Uncharacterized protein n=1 Tax=Ancylostoma duodenale TaxID=51022 RepID=A0A0C2GI27_9BILA|nr:hypothetical protein ANCDUO_08891 [Ancylostoma duodenale]